MSVRVEPQEVLAYLNRMGFCHVTAEQLKAFIKDLKKLIKHDLRQCKCSDKRSCDESCTTTSNSDSYFHDNRPCSSHKENECTKLSSCTSEQDETDYSCTSSEKSESDEENRKQMAEVQFIERKKQSKTQKVTDRPRSSFIKPWQLQMPATHRRTDPVALYHKYQSMCGNAPNGVGITGSGPNGDVPNDNVENGYIPNSNVMNGNGLKDKWVRKYILLRNRSNGIGSNGNGLNENTLNGKGLNVPNRNWMNSDGYLLPKRNIQSGPKGKMYNRSPRNGMIPNHNLLNGHPATVYRRNRKGTDIPNDGWLNGNVPNGNLQNAMTRNKVHPRGSMRSSGGNENELDLKMGNVGSRQGNDSNPDLQMEKTSTGDELNANPPLGGAQSKDPTDSDVSVGNVNNTDETSNRPNEGKPKGKPKGGTKNKGKPKGGTKNKGKPKPCKKKQGAPKRGAAPDDEVPKKPEDAETMPVGCEHCGDKKQTTDARPAGADAAKGTTPVPDQFLALVVQEVLKKLTESSSTEGPPTTAEPTETKAKHWGSGPMLGPNPRPIRPPYRPPPYAEERPRPMYNHNEPYHPPLEDHHVWQPPLSFEPAPPSQFVHSPVYLRDW